MHAIVTLLVIAPATPPDLEDKVDVLTEEVRRLREQMVLPETAEMKGSFGMGPAASKVYRSGGGLSQELSFTLSALLFPSLVVEKGSEYY